ncbi:MAG: 2-oxoacid:ferredoxin oxidoreductase subunit beta [Xanthomonadales bacterium]|nr:2-oxoacid:ferredoxin oxidoreductase subunit beta [Xanthomonadales bacterium]NIN60056.1 2-oxoacid:ferredoxin oxidoreductase subunit beta [Xanthomonadales bacterium]NIN75424.1 2-oxoacid:ferredoxin oxidoreductase subunit beta [Xanthomonadales bacterium]NIO14247.1 2-oxoacid:ferredoxin oxidoreductase subunit beta [Xanthomonadales bacterium]NIP12449.1 2-oxoacid:ferredoxin oxidoreductase subunit beta [Xanthomonadales bacterium]
MSAIDITLKTAANEHPIDHLLRADRLPHILCPGCGIGTVIHGYAHAIAASGIPEDNHVCVSGIGCSGRAAGYVNVDSYHSTHGRALPFALGIAVHRPELKVTVISGDGDLSAIGGNHLIHAARRNVDLTVICINNFNYGMTGGQVGPTTPIGARGTTAPEGAVEAPFNLPYLAKATGAVFVARWTILHVREFQDAVLRAMQKKGFCFIEVLAPCPTSFGKSNKIGDGLHEVEIYRERCRIENGAANIEDFDIDLVDETKPIVVGNFVDIERKIFQAHKR